MARLLCVAFFIVFSIIEPTTQKRHGFKPEILHITDEERPINSPVEMNPVLLSSYVLRSKRETKMSNDDEITKPNMNNGKKNFRDGNSSIDLQVNVKSNMTIQTTNNITTMVSIHSSLTNINHLNSKNSLYKFITFNRIQFISNLNSFVFIPT